MTMKLKTVLKTKLRNQLNVFDFSSCMFTVIFKQSLCTEYTQRFSPMFVGAKRVCVNTSVYSTNLKTVFDIAK